MYWFVCGFASHERVKILGEWKTACLLWCLCLWHCFIVPFSTSWTYDDNKKAFRITKKESGSQMPMAYILHKNGDRNKILYCMFLLFLHLSSFGWSVWCCVMERMLNNSYKTIKKEQCLNNPCVEEKSPSFFYFSLHYSYHFIFFYFLFFICTPKRLYLITFIHAIKFVLKH